MAYSRKRKAKRYLHKRHDNFTYVTIKDKIAENYTKINKNTGETLEKNDKIF